MLSRSNYKQYRDHQVDKACLDGLAFGAEIALSQAKGFSITPTTTKAEIKTAFDEEIARQRTATIALVKEETEVYDIAIGQQVDGVVLFPPGEQGQISSNRHKHLLSKQGDKDKMVAKIYGDMKLIGSNLLAAIPEPILLMLETTYPTVTELGSCNWEKVKRDRNGATIFWMIASTFSEGSIGRKEKIRNITKIVKDVLALETKHDHQLDSLAVELVTAFRVLKEVSAKEFLSAILGSAITGSKAPAMAIDVHRMESEDKDIDLISEFQNIASIATRVQAQPVPGDVQVANLDITGRAKRDNSARMKEMRRTLGLTEDQCVYCGEKHARGQKCKSRDSICTHCQGKGHLAIVCFKRASGSKPMPATAPHDTTPSVDVSKLEVEDEDMGDFHEQALAHGWSINMVNAEGTTEKMESAHEAGSFHAKKMNGETSTNIFQKLKKAFTTFADRFKDHGKAPNVCVVDGNTNPFPDSVNERIRSLQLHMPTGEEAKRKLIFLDDGCNAIAVSRFRDDFMGDVVGMRQPMTIKGVKATTANSMGCLFSKIPAIYAPNCELDHITIGTNLWDGFGYKLGPVIVSDNGQRYKIFTGPHGVSVKCRMRNNLFYYADRDEFAKCILDNSSLALLRSIKEQEIYPQLVPLNHRGPVSRTEHNVCPSTVRSSVKEAYTFEKESELVDAIVNLHRTTGHMPMEQLATAIASGALMVQKGITPQAVRSVAAMKIPCKVCLSASGAIHPSTHTEPRCKPVAPGHVHIDPQMRKGLKWLVMYDEYTRVVRCRPIESKERHSIVGALKWYQEQSGHPITVVYADYESCCNLGDTADDVCKGAKCLNSVPFRHEKLVERIVQEVSKIARKLMLEAHYSLDTFLYKEILRAAEHIYNTTPNINTSPLTPRQMEGDHRRYNTMALGAKIPFGTAVKCEASNSTRVDPKGEIGILLGPELNSTGHGYRVLKRKPHPTTNAQYQIVVRSTFTALEFRQVTFPDITFNAHYVVMRNESDTMANAPSMKDADLMEKASSYLGDAPDVQKTRRRALAQLNRSLAATHKSIDEDSDQEDDEINADDLVIPTHDEDDDDLNDETAMTPPPDSPSQPTSSPVNRAVTFHTDTVIHPAPEPHPAAEPRYPTRSRGPPSDRAANAMSVFNVEEMITHRALIPSAAIESEQISLRSALNHPTRSTEMRQAVIDELQQMQNMGVLTPWASSTPLPADKIVLPSSIFVKVKYTAQGNFDKVKARLVAGGHKEPLNNDPHLNISSPVVSDVVVKIIFAIAAARRVKLKAIDIAGAFLRVPMQRDNVFVRLPRDVSVDLTAQAGLTTVEQKGQTIYRVDKCLYGLRESGLRFYEELRTTMVAAGWKPSQLEPCLFTKASNGEQHYAVCHVDDLLILATTREAEELKKNLINRFESVTYEEEATSYVGYNIEYATDGIKINQLGFIKAYTAAHGILPTNPVPSPLSVNVYKTAQRDSEMADSEEYASELGAVQFVCKTRLNILTWVSFLAQHQAAPTRTHATALRKIWVYLASTANEGLYYRSSCAIELTAYCDASWHTHETGHGHSGFMLSLGQRNAPILAVSKKQMLIACSSAEAELMAMFLCAQKGAFVRQIMEDLGYKVKQPTTVLSDSIPAITMASQYHHQQASKHIARRFLWVNEQVRLGHFTFKYVATKRMRADILTKLMCGKTFQHCSALLLGADHTQ